MPANVLDVTDVVGKDAFTSKGSYCGKIRDVELSLPKFRVRAVVVDAARGSYLAEKVGGKKGVIVPYSMVNAVDDVVMIKHFSGSVSGEEELPEGEVEEAGEEQELYQKEKVEEA